MLRVLTDATVRGGEYYGPRFMFRGAAPVRETPTRTAGNPEVARDQWVRSIEPTGLEAELFGILNSK